MGLLRTDYMLDDGLSESHPELSLRQVEVNTIAAGMGGLGTQVAYYHRYIFY